ncbi:Transaldolase [Aspergillus sclerotialis]|uniref:Transaldolase n=1 Tax=Aspergillus sclerotialis TaxID=2070753 RepID=A0A3A2ZV08_9EURO|nr:Transaldolase [Aspergillus sclerotialis]
MNVLKYIHSRTQIDIDSFDPEAALKGGPYGPWNDATSNPAEVYSQITDPRNATIVKKAIDISGQIHTNFPGVSEQELRVEVVTVLLAARVISFIKGAVHVMANPCYAFSTGKVIAMGHRYNKIFLHIDPTFDTSRIIMKVPATFEGLRACRELRKAGIKTLATTVFTIEQAITAGEAGCISISPYEDESPLLGLCVKAQKYYEQHCIATLVKACSCMSMDEIIQLAGVAAHTIPPQDIDTLRTMHLSEAQLNSQSLFKNDAWAVGSQKRRSYIDDEVRYRVEFAAAENGDGQAKLFQAISMFCDFQKEAEWKMTELTVAV